MHQIISEQQRLLNRRDRHHVDDRGFEEPMVWHALSWFQRELERHGSGLAATSNILFTVAFVFSYIERNDNLCVVMLGIELHDGAL